MPKFYFQIKGKNNINPDNNNGFFGSYSNWVFPPIFSGMVEAKDKKEAKILIDELYNIKFPLRVLKKDIESNEFLLNIDEVKEDSHYNRLFEKQTCIHCNNHFYVIDKYNDFNIKNKGSQFCSDECSIEHNMIEKSLRNQTLNIDEIIGSNNPIIYKITNKISNKCYIGKTTQIFTLRWYQHFFQGGNCKFHEAIKQSKVNDWLFEVIDVIIIPDDIKKMDEINNLIIEKERFWIKHYNSIDDGYNTKI